MKKHLLVIKLLALLVLVGCGDKVGELPPSASKQVGPTKLYPGVVRLDSNGKVCSGTLVSERAVLTSNHCLIGVQTSLVIGDVQAVSTDFLRMGTGVPKDDKDLALIVLDSDAFQKKHIIPIGSTIQLGETLTLVGYGAESSLTDTGIREKRLGQNTVSMLESFIEFETPLFRRYLSELFGPENRAGVGSGDSGAPALNTTGGSVSVLGVAHAQYERGSSLISMYVDLTREDIRAELKQLSDEHELDIRFLERP